jgi:hypothetical protein
VEVAGEIATDFQACKVTLIHGYDQLLKYIPFRNLKPETRNSKSETIYPETLLK